MDAHTMRDAELVYNYHRTRMPLPASADAVFCLCSLDVRVAHRAAQLHLDGHGRYLIFSGGSGKLTEGRFTRPEAEVFADIARAQGVPEGAIIVEPRSTNTGENVRFTHDLLRRRGLLGGEGGIRSFILVQKPYMERRTYATFMRQWPGIDRAGVGGGEAVEFSVTSPQLEFAEYPDEGNPRDLVTNIMVGDLIRIRDYPAKGYQIQQDIPEDVWEAGQRLIAAGFNEHLP
ncbi:hypothetical protein KVR01_012426 [Diaporthe batatas]|uniref:uncharacterized protein n=1 Tax=Diaporthe batatas TaxID=748121 RepID=UPI001D03D0F0|nr:uncharacterized protein KVR01_012426 [Diaporthe batatas]KAG8157764.1 hypothetical protein KVR01_012426 [Diaporthe batatas]